MDATVQIVLLWVLFAVTHMVLSSATLRPALVRVLGDRGFLGVYSLIALLTFVWLCAVYGGHRHEGALLYAFAIPDALRFALYALQGVVAWILVVASFATPSPAALGSDAPDAAAVAPVHRITRHPLFGGVGLFGALHLPFMGFATDVAFWAGFPVFAVLGCWHQDRRKSATEDGFAAWLAATPFWIRPSPGAWRGLPVWVPPVGIALCIGLRYGHRLFGAGA